MRTPAALFTLVLAAAAAGWALAVRPVQDGSATALAHRAWRDARGAGEVPGGPEGWRGPDEAQVRRLEEALSFYGAAGAPVPRPEGVEEREPGTFAGRIRWVEVQDLLAWAAEREAPVLLVEVKATPDDPGSADCRVVLEAEAPR